MNEQDTERIRASKNPDFTDRDFGVLEIPDTPTINAAGRSANRQIAEQPVQSIVDACAVIFENAVEGIIVADTETQRLSHPNPAISAMFGYTPEEFAQLLVADLHPPETLARVAREFDAMVRGELKVARNIVCRRADGSTFEADITAAALLLDGRRQLIGFFTDVTERTRATEAVEHEAMTRHILIEKSADGVVVFDEQGGVCEASRRFAEMIGYSLDEIAHFYAWDLNPEHGPEQFLQLIRGLNDDNAHFETIHRRKDGTCYPVEVSAFPARSGGKNQVFCVYRDITERKAMENALRESESLLRATLESTGDGILVVDASGVATHLNSKFFQMWRIPDEIVASRDDKRMLRFVLDQLVDPDAFLAKVSALYGSSDESFDTLEFRDGRAFERYSCPLIRDGKIAGRVWSFRDISRRRQAEQARQRLQDRLERAQRMESLGLLAGGVAHDLNNILGPISGYAELITRDLPPDSKISSKLKRISRSAEDAAAVIQDLLTLARRGRYDMTAVDLNKMVSTFTESPTFESLRQRHPSVEVVVELATNHSAILGSEAHLHKAIMNLVVNAFEAMPNGGQLTIQTEQTVVQRLRSGYRGVKAGEYAILRVKDTGTGIAPEDIEKIFEPYFSRKKMGQSGSGLGLSVVYGVVKDHHGYYDVRSQVNRGTEFELYFPVTSYSFTHETSASIEVRGGTETILVVDDNSAQRELAGEVLASLGYSVRMVESGRKAVEFISKNDVDLVLLDMIMEPDFDGLDAYQAILRIRPNQKAVAVSGFSATDRVQKLLDLGAASYVKKPYTVDALAYAVRSALEKSKTSKTR